MIWYENDVKKLEALNGTLPYTPETVFYGSSSIRLWEGLYEDFKPFHPVNLGFGGATLAACVWFFDRIMQPYSPRHIVFYAGDNDLGDGRHGEEVYIFFNQLLVCLNNRYPGVPFSFISIKPSISRWNMVNQIRYTNQLIKNAIQKAGPHFYYVNIFDRMLDANGHPVRELFEADGLHLSKRGYSVWKEALLNHFATNFKIS
jgi:lysophospholipase L1-like esterase